MKRFLGVVLAVLMVLSTVSYAAPTMAETVETTKETATLEADALGADAMEEAEGAEVTTDLAVEQHVFGITFDNLETIASTQNITTVATTVNIPSNFPAGATFSLNLSKDAGGSLSLVAREEGSSDMVACVVPTSSWSRWYIQSNKDLPNGTYRLSNEMKADVEVKQNFNMNIFSHTNKPVADGGTDVTSTWQTFEKTYVYVMGETFKTEGYENLRGFQSYQNTNTITWYVDNINIYYTPESCKVTFAGKGPLPAAIDVLKNGNFVPSEYEPQFVPAGAKAFLGWSLTEDGEILDAPMVISEDTTVYAVYEEEETLETTSKYGQLAFHVDFEVANGTVVKPINGNGTAVSELTAYPAPAIDGMPADVRIVAYTSDYLTQNGKLIITNDDKYPRFYLQAYNGKSANGKFPAGVYTLEYNSSTNAGDARENSFFIMGTSTSKWPTSNIGRVKSLYNVVNEYNTFAGSVVYDGQYAYNEDGAVVAHSNGNNDLSEGLARFGVYCGSNNVAAVRSYDWVKLWYAPLEINLTLDANGKDVEVPETKAVHSLVKLSDYTLADSGTSRFAGWSETRDGEIITDATRIFSEDTTLYAVWDENYYATEEEAAEGDLLVDLHFNDIPAAVKDNHSNIKNYGTFGSRYNEVLFGGEDATIFFSSSDKNPDGSQVYGMKYSEYGVAGTYTHPDNSYYINRKVEAGKSAYPKVFLSAANYTLKDGIYTMFAEISLKDSVNSVVRYEAFANVKLEGAEAYADKALENTTLPADGNTYYVKKSFFVKDGYFGSLESGTMYKIDGAVKSKFGINFSIVSVDKTKEASAYIECDNFRIYYREYDYSPKSYTENSIRVGAPSGIRFKSSVTTVERNNEGLTEYGYIVTLKDLLGTTDVNDFTHETSVARVEGKNYIKANNVDKIFETKNDTFFFTAVIYNIPAGQYARDLVVRPYSIVDGKYVYGEAMVNNIAAVAEKIKASAEYETYKDAVDKILAGEEL